MEATYSASSLQVLLLTTGSVLVLFSASAFVIIGSFLMGVSKTHSSLLVLCVAAIVLWFLSQHILDTNLRPTMGYLGG